MTDRVTVGVQRDCRARLPLSARNAHPTMPEESTTPDPTTLTRRPYDARSLRDFGRDHACPGCGVGSVGDLSRGFDGVAAGASTQRTNVEIVR